MTETVLLAVKSGEVIGALDPAIYEGVDHHFPHGWQTLIDKVGNKFDVCDLSVNHEKIVEQMVEHYKP